ncbi:MAG: preprotein translocase subunit SecY [Angelakisella sp.]|jgi:preprotein translocase subunit SecY|nr:preprotein translocase subunit SecY [Angelakisella sp.]
MFETLKNAWKIEDLRKKLIYTMLILLVVRIGSAIPVPFIDPSFLKAMVNSTGNLLGYLDMLTGGAFSQATLFALSISPYITSSIVIQLLTVAIPALERMAKEGPEGQERLKKITRYTTVALAVLQAVAFYTMFRNSLAVAYTDGFFGVLAAVTIVGAFTAGAMLVVWLGERIDEKGIGNGISLILFAGIVSRIPAAVGDMIKVMLEQGGVMWLWVPLIGLVFLAEIAFIVLMNNAERRIPVQYAKKVVGRKMYGGQSSFMPIKVNMSGVLPVIFASTFLAIPGTIGGFLNLDPIEHPYWTQFFNMFSYRSLLYAVLYFLLIIGFNYFYIAIQYNPIEMANNLRKNNGAIPGIRPGKPTSDFITKVISKITLVGALMLAAIAILPILITAVTGMNVALGGTSVIIIVGVALDTVRSLESQMMMRHYKGFLE